MESQLGFITDEVICLDLQSVDKEAVIGELVDLLVASGSLSAENRDAVLEAIMERERLGSTGIGSGLAIPHAKASPLVDRMVGAFGRSTRGVEFGASDGEPCSVFILMVSPEDAVQEHIQILRKIALLQRNEHFLRFLNEAGTKEEVRSILQEVSES